MYYNGPNPKEDEEYDRMSALGRRQNRAIKKYFRSCEKNLSDLLDEVEIIREDMKNNRII